MRFRSRSTRMALVAAGTSLLAMATLGTGPVLGRAVLANSRDTGVTTTSTPGTSQLLAHYVVDQGGSSSGESANTVSSHLIWSGSDGWLLFKATNRAFP